MQPELAQLSFAGDGVCGERGYVTGLSWSTPAEAVDLAGLLVDAYAGREVVRNPHLEHDWARQAVRAPALLKVVGELVGPSVAVENTFLMLKWPGTAFAVPAHQDGINDRVVLDPSRAVAVWLAVTAATAHNGCLEVIPGSQTAGYRPYRPDATRPAREGGQPLTAHNAAGDEGFTKVVVDPGQACAMDVRLLHRSGPNRSPRPRVGLNIRYVAPEGLRVRDGPPPSLDPLMGDGW